MAKDKTIGISARISPTLHEELSDHACKVRRSIAETVRIALEEYLEKETKKAA